MGTLGNFKTDLKKAHEDGAEVEIGKGFFITLLRLHNPAYQAYLHQHMQGKAKRLTNQDWGALEEAKPVLKRAVAITVVKDWRGMTDNKGNEILYSEAKAVEILTDPAYEDLYDIILDLAGDASTYRQKAFEEDAGN